MSVYPRNQRISNKTNRVLALRNNNALYPLACFQVDLPDGHVSKVGSTLMATATRVALSGDPKSLVQPIAGQAYVILAF
jgi:hypothetical protein